MTCEITNIRFSQNYVLSRRLSKNYFFFGGEENLYTIHDAQFYRKVKNTTILFYISFLKIKNTFMI